MGRAPHHRGGGRDPPKARGGHTAVLVEKNLIVQGGQQHKSAGTFEYFTLNPTVLDTETHTWFTPRVALGKGPIERAFHSTTRVGSGLYTFGGQTAKVAGESGLLGDLIIFDLHRMCWDTKDVRGKKPRARFMHSAELCEGKLFIYGGSDGTKSLSDVSILDIGTNLWSSPICTGSVPPGLQAHTCTIVGERLFVVGGMSISLDDAGHSFIKCARTSTALSPSPFHLFTHTLLRFALLSLTDSNDVHILDSKTMEWSRLTQRGELPKPRAYHSAAVVGNFLVVMGGWSGQVRRRERQQQQHTKPSPAQQHPARLLSSLTDTHLPLSLRITVREPRLALDSGPRRPWHVGERCGARPAACRELRAYGDRPRLEYSRVWRLGWRVAALRGECARHNKAVGEAAHSEEQGSI